MEKGEVEGDGQNEIGADGKPRNRKVGVGGGRGGKAEEVERPGGGRREEGGKKGRGRRCRKEEGRGEGKDKGGKEGRGVTYSPHSTSRSATRCW